MSAIEPYGYDESGREQTFTPEQQQRAFNYYLAAQNSLSLLANFSAESPLSQVGAEAVKVVQSGKPLQDAIEREDASVVIDPTTTVLHDFVEDNDMDGLITFALEPMEDVDDMNGIPPIMATMQINIGGILGLEGQLTPKEIEDLISIDLAAQNHHAAVYLDGRLAKEGFVKVAREAVTLRHAYTHAEIGGPTHTQIPPDELTDTLREAMTRDVLGERYYADITFEDFIRAAQIALRNTHIRQAALEKPSPNRDPEEAEVLKAELGLEEAYLQTICSKDEDTRQLTMNIFARAVYSDDFMSSVLDNIAKTFVSVLGEERGVRRQQRPLGIPNFRQTEENEERALKRFHGLTDVERRAIVAERVIGILMRDHFPDVDDPHQPNTSE